MISIVRICLLMVPQLREFRSEHCCKVGGMLDDGAEDDPAWNEACRREEVIRELAVDDVACELGEPCNDVPIDGLLSQHPYRRYSV